MPIKNNACLIEFTKQGGPEEKDERLPTVAIGCAQQIVDPFLGYIRKLFWPNRLPSLAEGKLAAYWALDYGIKSAPGGVGEPKVLAVLKKEGDWKAEILPEIEREEHKEFIDGIEKYISCFNPNKTCSESAPSAPPVAT